MPKILIIDDKQDNLISIAALMRNLISECTVITAQSGIEGIEKAKIELPDTILLDINMPEMDGYETCKRLKSDNNIKNIPVIMLSAIKTDSQSRIKGLKFGADAFLTKPIDAGELTAQINAMLRIKKAEDLLRKEKDFLEDLVTEKTKALCKSEKRFRELVELLPEAVLEIDLEGNVIFSNKMASDIFGYSKEDFNNGLNWFQLIFKEERTRQREAFTKYMERKFSESAEHIAQRKDGSRFPVIINCNTIVDEKNNTVGLRCVLTDITKSKQIAEKLEENEKYLRFLFDSVQSGLVIIDAETHKIIDANPAAIKMIASSKKNIVGNICHNYICPNEIGQCPITDLKRKVDSSGCYLLNQNGEKIPIVKNVVPIINNGHKYLIESFIDISELKKSEDVLRENEAKYRNVVENSNDSICIVQDHMIKFCNQQATNLIGYSSDEIINTSFINFIHPHELQKTLGEYTSFMAGEQDNLKFETTLIHKNGHNIIVELNVSVTKYNARRAALVFIRDITDHKKAEEELKKTKSHLEYLVSSVPSVIYSCETYEDFAPTYVSANLVRVLGYTPEEFLSDPKFWVNHIHPDDVSTTLENFEKLFKKDTMIQEYRFLHKNGTYLWLNNNCTVIRDQKDNPVEIVGSFIDITDKKSLEEQFHQSQKMEAVGRLAGGIAHDFNNLLQMIIGCCDLLLLGSEDIKQNKKDLKEIKKAGSRAASLTRQLLTFSRKQSVKPILLNLNVVISDLAKMLKRLIGEDIVLETILTPNLKTMKADQAQIEQVIMNLVVNARDAMQKGGKLTIRTENVIIEGKNYYNTSDARPGEFICLSVEDKGIGIDKKIIDHIFEPFFSTKKKGEGTGLGLSVVYGIVKQHDGWINIESTIGKGTTFKIYVPTCSQKSEDMFSESLSLVEFKGNGERILVVEDEIGVREFTARALRNAGYTVFEASGVQEALDIIKTEKGRFDLLLSDVVLPDQSGLFLMNHLKVMSPKTRIIMCSGYTDQKSQWEIIRTKGIDFIQKPYSLIELLKSVKNSLQLSLTKC